VDEARLRPFAALRALRRRGYSAGDLRADAGAGIVLGVVALPLSMALAIAAGAPPENGLFTAIVAGLVVSLLGGSMHSVSGPTAAFVVLLSPVTARYGLGGLLVATLMAGAILVLMGLLRLGRLIQFIPHPVTTGFTAGIGVVIAVLQLGDLVGLGRLDGERIWDKLADLGARASAARWPDLLVGLATLAVLLAFPRLAPRLSARLPAPLVALVGAALLALALDAAGFGTATIDSQFGGIPPVPPLPRAPWAGAALDWPAVASLAPTAAAIALLGAIESLLCAVVGDGMAGSRHDPDAELIGLGIGNLVAPFFGGFAATGAIARTATGIRAGSRTPVAVVVHSLFLLAAMLALAPLLGFIPMAAMAGLLLKVAWDMSEADHVVRMVRVAPRSDVTVLLVCLVLTVVFDMVVAVVVGIVLAALLFMRRMVEISGASLVADGRAAGGLPPGVVFYDVAGPLFFGAAEKALGVLTVVGPNVHTVILDLEDVPAVDATGLVALETAVSTLNRSGAQVVLAGLQDQPRRVLVRAGLTEQPGRLAYADTPGEAVAAARAPGGRADTDAAPARAGTTRRGPGGRPGGG